jgi:hypothetical protein
MFSKAVCQHAYGARAQQSQQHTASHWYYLRIAELCDAAVVVPSDSWETSTVKCRLNLLGASVGTVTVYMRRLHYAATAC